MDYTRGIKTGFIAYAANLVALSMLQNILLPFIGGVAYAEYIWQGIVLIVTAVSVYYASRWFFENGTASLQNGAILGVFVTIFSLVLLVIQALPGATVAGKIGEFMTNFGSLFTDYGFILSVVVTLAAATYAGYSLKK